MTLLSKFKTPPKRNQHGFTLIEGLIAVAIIAILAALALPSYVDFIQKGRAKNATEEVYAIMSQARSEASIRDSDIFVDFIGGANGCIGFTTKATCTCSVTNVADATSCTVQVGAPGNNVLQILPFADFDDVTITPSITTSTTWDRVRGSVGGHSIHVRSGNWGLSTVVSAAGRIRVCINSLTDVSLANGGYNNGVTGFEDCS